MDDNHYFDEKQELHVKPADVTPTRRISAYVVVQHEGKMLLVKSYDCMLWEIPGGGIEELESIREGAVRELYEETGYRITVPGEPFFMQERNFYSLRFQKYFKSTLLFFTASLASEVQDGQVINTVVKNEIAEVSWMYPKDIPLAVCNPIYAEVIKSFV